MPAVVLLGRFLLGLIFVASAVTKLQRYGYWDAILAGRGLEPTWVLLPAAIAVELAGGLMVITGWYARLGATILALLLVPATVWFHTELVRPMPPMMAMGAEVHVMKNLALIGALLLMAAQGPGPWSLGGPERRR